jgi:hypothetical protein
MKFDTHTDNIYKIAIESKNDLRKDLAHKLVTSKLGLLEMHADKVTLEDIFLHLTTKEEVA